MKGCRPWWNLLGLEADRFDPIENAPEEWRLRFGWRITTYPP